MEETEFSSMVDQSPCTCERLDSTTSIVKHKKGN